MQLNSRQLFKNVYVQVTQIPYPILLKEPEPAVFDNPWITFTCEALSSAEDSQAVYSWFRNGLLQGGSGNEHLTRDPGNY